MKNKTCCWVLVILGGLLMLAVLGTGMLVAVLISSSGSQGIVGKSNFIVAELNGPLKEYQRTPSIHLLNERESPTVANLLLAINGAATDDRIEGLILKPRAIGGFAELRELREAIRVFKQSGKPVYAYLEMATDRDYYLASIADTIVMVPSNSGGLVMLGLAIAETYLARTFEKVGIKFNVVHVGDYKGAYENLARDEMSDSLRVSLQTLIDDMFDTYVTETEADRRVVSKTDLEKLYFTGDEYLISGDSARSKRLVDLVLSWPDLLERLAVEANEVVSVDRYVSAIDKPTAGREIAVVFAEGAINYVQDPTDPLRQGAEIIPDELVQELGEIRDDSSIAAVVLRVNSPGGSSLASELILQEINRLKEVKPVVVSMGNVAASGGYYISCSADYIIAQPNTVTGSIGVVGVLPSAEKLFEKIGAHVEIVEKGKWSHFLRLDKDMTDEQRRVMMKLMQGIYKDFIDRVAEGRGLPNSEVEAVASGRVWTGKQALSRHLIDELGGLDAAVGKARALSGLNAENSHVGYYPRKQDLLSFLEDRFLMSMQDIEWRIAYPLEERQALLAVRYLEHFLDNREFVQLLSPVGADIR